MKHSKKRKGCIIVILLVLLQMSIIQNINAEWWSMFGHDINHSRYSTSPAPDTNNIRWTYTTSGEIESSPAVIDGRMYVGSADGRVLCLDALSGDFVWEYITGSYVDSSPAVADGKVYIGSYDGRVLCLDAMTGGFVWEYATGDYVHSSPAVADGKVYVGSADTKLYCLDAMTGDFVWEYITGSYVDSSPAVADGKVYIGSYDGRVLCLDAMTGGFVWEYATGDYVHSSPAVADGKVYVGSADTKLYCLDTMTGDLVWSYTTQSYVHSSPAVADGKVYVGSNDYHVYCLDALSGDFVWDYTTGSYVDSSPGVADGNVYIGSDDKKIYCLNAFTGNLIWSYTTGGHVKSSPAVAEENIYIGSNNKKMYCFGALPSGGGGGSEPPRNNNPVADTSAGEPYHGRINTEIIFNGSRSFDPDGTIVTWFWDFGDGTNGTGEVINHTYASAGQFTVTLRVRDNKGSTHADTTTCIITKPNQPPSNPIITGLTQATKQSPVFYTVVSIDPDNDTIVYLFDWGDLQSQESPFLPSGTECRMNHSWRFAGCYHLTVIATDTQAQSSSNLTVYIDAMPIADIGYLLDLDSDGLYDTFYSDALNQTVMTQKKDDGYLIDSNGDKEWDYLYNSQQGLTRYTQSFTPDFTVIVYLVALAVVLLMSIKRKK